MSKSDEVGGQTLPVDSTHARGLWNIAATVVLVLLLCSLVQMLLGALITPLNFDDAYMFARYAAHMRHGLGMAWNQDGVPTYGPTSLPWVVVVWGLSFLPVSVWTGLVLGSWLCALGALVAMAWAVAANSQTVMLRSVWRVLPLLAVPLVATYSFSGNAFTGMETMFAALVDAVFMGVALLWSRGTVRSEWVGAVGVLSFLARPESGIAVVLLPVLVYLLKPYGGVKRRSLVTLLGVFAIGVGLDLLGCRLYFHTALPLSFYMKGHRAYVGYTGVVHPELLMLGFLAACQLYWVTMILLAQRQQLRLIACCVLPALAVFAYLQSVTQIMGFHSRYYMPYLAYFVVPGILVAEQWWVGLGSKVSWVRGSIAVAAVLGLAALSSNSVQKRVVHLERQSHFAYDAPVLTVEAKTPLPDVPWQEATKGITNLLVAELPRGATVAATEVGYLGSGAPQVNVIDMAGLNDAEIALQGFNAKALLERKPDVIWMPHTDYTYMRGELFSAPGLLQEYDVYDGASKYGLAVRKDSPYSAALQRQMQVYWQTAYPGTKMEEYLVRSVSWSGSGHLVVGE